MTRTFIRRFRAEMGSPEWYYRERPARQSRILPIARLRPKFDASVNFGQRQVDIDLGQRDHGVEPLVDLAHKTGFGAAEDGDQRRLLLDEQVHVERWNRQVSVLLLAFVDAACALG